MFVGMGYALPRMTSLSTVRMMPSCALMGPMFRDKDPTVSLLLALVISNAKAERIAHTFAVCLEPPVVPTMRVMKSVAFASIATRTT